ncbi:MAG: hypothetical protein WDO70_06935 [Alphaproteobacteria bacterium]
MAKPPSLPHHPDATWHLRSGAEIENFFQRAEYSDRRMTLRHSLTRGPDADALVKALITPPPYIPRLPPLVLSDRRGGR